MYNDNKFKRKMRKMTLYVVRFRSEESSECNMAHSAPCKHCFNKIKQVGIKKLIYIDSDGNIQKCLTKNYSTNFISSGYKEYARKNIVLQYY